MLRFVVLLTTLLAFLPNLSVADGILLKDGSRINGKVSRLDAQRLFIETDFAGEIGIARDRIDMIETDGTVILSMASGERLIARLMVGTDGEQMLSGGYAGEQTVGLDQVTALWRQDEADPAALALLEVEERHKREIGRIEARQAERVAELEDRIISPDEAWSGQTQFGLSGASGNSDRVALNGKASVRRESSFDRLDLSLQGRFAREKGTNRENEVIADAKLERDFSEDAFVFGNLAMERDAFENLDLRSALTVGTGFFLVRTKEQDLKPRIGLGYQVEAFMDAPNADEAIFALGYDYRWKINGWMLLTHAFTYQPDLSKPADDFRVLSEANLDVAVADGSPWSVKLGVRNQYDSEPVDANEKLDTFYTVSLGYNFQ